MTFRGTAYILVAGMLGLLWFGVLLVLPFTRNLITPPGLGIPVDSRWPIVLLLVSCSLLIAILFRPIIVSASSAQVLLLGLVLSVVGAVLFVIAWGLTAYFTQGTIRLESGTTISGAASAIAVAGALGLFLSPVGMACVWALRLLGRQP